MLVVLTETHSDIVLGSRFLGTSEGLPRLRSMLLKAALLFTKAMSGLPLTDTHNGLRVMTADTARELKITQNRMAHASEIIDAIARLGLRYREVPVTIHYSDYSLGKGQKLTGSVDIMVDLFMGWLLR